jgi:hypothetical protein
MPLRNIIAFLQYLQLLVARYALTFVIGRLMPDFQLMDSARSGSVREEPEIQMKSLLIIGALGVILLVVYQKTLGDDTQTLIESTVQVAAGKMFLVPFTAAEPGWVRGQFRATGERGSDDIQVVIVNVDDYESWRTARSAPAYQSRQVPADSLNVSLRAGSYYLVFNNQFSTYLAKTVTANLKLYH